MEGKVHMKNDKQCVYEFTLKRERVLRFAEDDLTMSAPFMVAKFCQVIGLGDEETERVVVVMLDAKNKVRAYQTVAVGDLNQAAITPREVFRPAILYGSAKIAIAHNHPSNVVDPSIEDIQLVGKIIEAGKVVGIELIDSVIVGENGHLSFQEEGLMPNGANVTD
jgi:DNA repair protein RadC